MYGLLLENLATFIKAQWGEGKWESVRRHAGIDLVAFSIHHVYPETLMRRLARSAFQVLGVDERQFFKAMGVYFVQYVSQYGYDQLLSVLGRHLRDFLNGLDNLHEYLKFSYPKMRAPSFYCDDETESGLKLHYRSKRRGFVYYVMGQIKQVAKQFYNQECNIHLLNEEVVGETIHVVFELAFDNSAFSEAEELRTLIGKDLRLPVKASTLFELEFVFIEKSQRPKCNFESLQFPFCIVFNSEMEITHTGHTLMTILKDLVGQVMTEAFDMTRPLIPFCFSAIMQRRNNIFELVTVAPIHDVNQFFGATDSVETDVETEGTRLRLRGQMLFMEEWNMMLYLANPVMPDLNGLVDCSLFINDLSLHDCSRDLVLAGTQQSVELKLALDQEQQKSKKLVQSMMKLDLEMKRTDELLYQMIPKQVADRIRKGENPVETCQTFDSVSILFTDVVNFTDICSVITPLQVVSMLNHIYFLFDQLCERNGVYKVETVGDSYMIVSGAPVSNTNHSERCADMALDIIDASEAIDDPSGRENGLRVRVGCHSGACVAGVVGIKMPRYCLFGDTVNTASRMESTSEPGRVQISEACKNLLSPLYSVELRGTINVKGKGEMYTYYLLGREARVPLSKYYSKTIIWTPPTAKLLDGIGRPNSPNSLSHKHIDRTESLSMASPSSSGTSTSKNQKVAASSLQTSSVRAKPQFKPIVTPRSTISNNYTSAMPNATIRPSIIPTSTTAGGHELHSQFSVSNNRSMSSPELQMSTDRPSFESDDDIQVYFNKNLETKRKEASASVQAKHQHKKIHHSTSVYDSDLIKEALKSKGNDQKPSEVRTSTPISPTPSGKHGVKSLSAEVLAEASMIMAGILPDLPLPHNLHEKRMSCNIPTGVGEGLLTEYIIAVEKKLDDARKVGFNAGNLALASASKVNKSDLIHDAPSSGISGEMIMMMDFKDDDDQHSTCNSSITDPMTSSDNFKDGHHFSARPEEKIETLVERPSSSLETTTSLNKHFPYFKQSFTTNIVSRKDSFSTRDMSCGPQDKDSEKAVNIHMVGEKSVFTFSNKDITLSSLIEQVLKPPGKSSGKADSAESSRPTPVRLCNTQELPTPGKVKHATSSSGQHLQAVSEDDLEEASTQSIHDDIENSLVAEPKKNFPLRSNQKPALSGDKTVKRAQDKDHQDTGTVPKKLGPVVKSGKLPLEQLKCVEEEEDFVELKPAIRASPIKIPSDGNNATRLPLTPEPRKPHNIQVIAEENDFKVDPVAKKKNIQKTKENRTIATNVEKKKDNSVFGDQLAEAPKALPTAITPISDDAKLETPNNNTTLANSASPILISNKLAEVRVAKWIRDEFVESKNDSTKDEDSDDEFDGDPLAQACDEKWIVNELTDDGSEKWAVGEFPEIFNKDQQGSKPKAQGETPPLIAPISVESVDGSSTKVKQVSTKLHSSSSGGTMKQKQLATKPLPDSPKWKVEVKAISHKPPSAPATEKPEKSDVMKMIPKSGEGKGQNTKDSVCSKKEDVTMKNKCGTAFDRRAAAIPKSLNLPLEPHQRVSQIASNWENRVIERSWEITRAEGGPEFQHVVIPTTSEILSKNKPQVRTLKESVQVEPPTETPQNLGTKMESTDSSSDINPPSVSPSSSKYNLFSSEFGNIHVFSPDLAKSINKNCTKFCYDCLSIPSLVDNDSGDMDVMGHPLSDKPEEVKKARQPEGIKMTTKPVPKEAPVKKQKIFNIFNRI